MATMRDQRDRVGIEQPTTGKSAPESRGRTSVKRNGAAVAAKQARKSEGDEGLPPSTAKQKRRELASAIAHVVVMANMEAGATTSEAERRKLTDIALVAESLLRAQVPGEEVPAELSLAARKHLERKSRSQTADRLLELAEAWRSKLSTGQLSTDQFVRDVHMAARSLGFRPAAAWDDPRWRDVAVEKMAVDSVEAVEQALHPIDEETTVETTRLIEVTLRAYGINPRGMFDHRRKAKIREM